MQIGVRISRDSSYKAVIKVTRVPIGRKGERKVAEDEREIPEYLVPLIPPATVSDDTNESLYPRARESKRKEEREGRPTPENSRGRIPGVNPSFSRKLRFEVSGWKPA